MGINLGRLLGTAARARGAYLTGEDQRATSDAAAQRQAALDALAQFKTLADVDMSRGKLAHEANVFAETQRHNKATESQSVAMLESQEREREAARAAAAAQAQSQRDFQASQAAAQRDFVASQNAATRAARQQANGGTNPKQLAATAKLSGLYSANPIVKNANTIAEQYEVIKAGAAQQNAQGDMALIFGLMKLYDPGSVVREGEYATAKNAASVPDQIRNAWNKAQSGQFLTPGQRQSFLNLAKDRVGAQRQLLSPIASHYGRLAESQGIDSADVALDPFAGSSLAAPSPAPRSAPDVPAVRSDSPPRARGAGQLPPGLLQPAADAERTGDPVLDAHLAAVRARRPR